MSKLFVKPVGSDCDAVELCGRGMDGAEDVPLYANDAPTAETLVLPCITWAGAGVVHFQGYTGQLLVNEVNVISRMEEMINGANVEIARDQDGRFAARVEVKVTILSDWKRKGEKEGGTADA